MKLRAAQHRPVVSKLSTPRGKVISSEAEKDVYFVRHSRAGSVQRGDEVLSFTFIAYDPHVKERLARLPSEGPIYSIHQEKLLKNMKVRIALKERTPTFRARSTRISLAKLAFKLQRKPYSGPPTAGPCTIGV